MAKKWFTEFKSGRSSTSDVEYSGHSIRIVTVVTIEKKNDMVLAYRKLKVRDIVRSKSVSYGSVASTLNDELCRKSYLQNGCHVNSQLTTNAVL